MARPVVYPIIAPVEYSASPIEVPGWNQSMSSPFIYSPQGYRPDWVHGPWEHDFTRGRHAVRTIPRGNALIDQSTNVSPPPSWDPSRMYSSTIVDSSPNYAHGYGELDEFFSQFDKPIFYIVAAAVGGFLLYSLLKKKR